MNMPKAKEAHVVFDLGDNAIVKTHFTLRARLVGGIATWRLHVQPPGTLNESNAPLDLPLDDAVMRALVKAYNTMEQL